MTTQPTYIYSDAECVLIWLKDYPGPLDRSQKDLLKRAKSTAVKFANQDYAGGVIALKYGTIKPNTIYTVEGYGVDENMDSKCCMTGKLPTIICGDCKNLKFEKTATLKRIDEPVVEQENDGWIIVEDRMPGNHQHVLTYGSPQHDGIYIRHCWYQDGIFRFANNGNENKTTITHWMPLPNPPKQ